MGPKKLLIILLLLIFESANARDCQKKRGAFDFGSGTTKALVALVDVCEKKIIEIVFEERIPLALNEALEKSPNNEIPVSVINDKMPTLQSFVKKIKEETGSEKVDAIATSVFRVAKNGPGIAKLLSNKLNISVQIISQEREAELGYWSVLAKQKGSHILSSIIVWDIGGGSMQMYGRGPKNKVVIYKGDLASVSFKNKILEVLQFKNLKEVSSPNPIGSQRMAAIQLAKNHAYLNVPLFFKENVKKNRWVGIGGVLAMSVQKQVNAKAQEFTEAELADTLKLRAHLKDSEINSDYRITDISNLALVLGYMQALNIKKIETTQASLGQGLLYYKLIH